MANIPLSNRRLEALMRVRAESAVWEAGEWLTAAQIAGLTGSSTANPDAQTDGWKRGDLIFAIRRQNQDYFPLYGLDPERNYHPTLALREVIQVFDGKKDAWGMAFWFAAVNSFLGGRRPQDILSLEPEQVIAAALDEMKEISHG